MKHSGSSIQITGTSADPYREDGKPITSDDTAKGIRIRATYGGTSGWLVRDGHATTKIAFPGRKLPEDEQIEDWEFRAGSLIASHQRPQDETYLYFGIWAREPKDKDGTPDFKWIAGGGQETPQPDFAALTGTARFVGGAVGQYAIDKTATGGSADIGIFTATATFDAAFDVDGDGTVNANTENKLSGSITGFRKMEDGSALAGTLYLGGSGGANPPATLAGGGGGVETVAGASGTIDGVKVTGSWEAKLYGVDNQDPPEGATCPNGCAADVAGITGWFSADENDAPNGAGSVVAISGAFGAAKQ